MVYGRTLEGRDSATGSMLGVDMSQSLYSNATMPLRIDLYVMATSRTDKTHRFRSPWIHFAQRDGQERTNSSLLSSPVDIPLALL
jgi:hypothetical protein